LAESLRGAPDRLDLLGVCLGNRFPTANIAKAACEPRTTAPACQTLTTTRAFNRQPPTSCAVGGICDRDSHRSRWGRSCRERPDSAMTPLMHGVCSLGCADDAVENLESLPAAGGPSPVRGCRSLWAGWPCSVLPTSLTSGRGHLGPLNFRKRRLASSALKAQTSHRSACRSPRANRLWGKGSFRVHIG